jgi:hypothetical protein
MFPSDMPGASVLVMEDEAAMVKGNTAVLLCILDDGGSPVATEFSWTK